MGELFNNPRIPFLELTFGDEAIPFQLMDHVPSVTGRRALLEEAVYTETTMGGGNILEMTLFDPDYDRLEELFIRFMNKVKFRFGWRGVPGRESQEREGWVWQLQPEILPMQGTRLRVKLLDRPFAQLLQQCISKGFTQKKVSEMVATIARENSILDTIITPTLGNFDRRVGNMSPYKFIKTALLPLAKTKDGRSNFNFHFKGPRLIFSPPEPNVRVIRRYLYGRDQFGDLISFLPNFENAYAIMLGGGNQKARGVDPLTKRPIETTQTDATNVREPKLATKAIEPDPAQGGSTLARIRAPKGQHINRIYHVPFNTIEEVEAWSKYKRARAEQMRFTADAEVVGDPNIHPMDYVEVLVVKTADIRALDFDRDVHRNASGSYRVQAVTHTINAGGYTTSMSLFRENSFLGTLDIQGFVNTVLASAKILLGGGDTITKASKLIALFR